MKNDNTSFTNDQVCDQQSSGKPGKSGNNNDQKPHKPGKNQNSNGRNGNGKGGNTNKPNDQGKGASEKKVPGPRNDISWHNKAKELFELATNITTFKIAGKPFYGTTQAGAQTYLFEGGNKITAFQMAPTPGYCDGPGDPFNKNMIMFFNKIRGRYTSSVPFQANDVATVVLAIGSVCANISHVQRSLESLGVSTFESYLTPELLHLATLGVDDTSHMIDSYKKDVADAPQNAYRLITLIRRLNGLYIPNMSYFDMCKWIFRHIYFEDATGFRGDVSMFVPAYYLLWSPTVPVEGAASAVASGCYYKYLNKDPETETITIGDWLDIIEEQIDALTSDDSVRTISGWIKQNVPNAMTVAEIANTDPVVPTHEAEMSLFIRGIKTVDAGNFMNKYINQDVTTESIRFIQNVGASTATPKSLTNHVINYKDVPSKDDIALSTVFTAIPKDGCIYTDVFACTRALIYHTGYGLGDGHPYYTIKTSTFEYSSSSASTQLGTVLMMHQSTDRPTLMFYSVQSGAMTKVSFDTDIDYQVEITATNAFNLHYASLSSLFHVDLD